MAKTRESVLRRRIHLLIFGFIVGLFLSGVTAFPLTREVEWLAKQLGATDFGAADRYTGTTAWIVTVRDGLRVVAKDVPFLFYSTDWLAFAHLVIALLFVGPYKDPIKNLWVIHWGIYACILVIPLALICGPLRGIPFNWQLIDCSFGVVGVIPLILCDRLIKQLEEELAKPKEAPASAGH